MVFAIKQAQIWRVDKNSKGMGSEEYLHHYSKIAKRRLIFNLLQLARSKVVRTVNQIMVHTYFEIGCMVIEEEQDGKERAAYGKEIIKELSRLLTKKFGKGFSERNIEQMRQFYLVYSKPQTVSAESENT